MPALYSLSKQSKLPFLSLALRSLRSYRYLKGYANNSERAGLARYKEGKDYFVSLIKIRNWCYGVADES